MSYLKSIGTVFIYIGLFLAVITFMPGLPPYIEFKEISSLMQPNLPKVDIKNRLTGAEKLFEGEINCPESFSSYNGQLYSGIHGGYVVRIEEDRFVPVVKFGEKCDGIWQEHKCGRPLGLQFDTKGNLYVVDTYYGIFKVNVATGEYKNIVNISKPIDGEVPRLPNSIDIAKNGDLYWSDSSADFALYDGLLTFLSNPSGRLIRYNEAKKKNEVLIRNLGFANGVVLSDDESFVLVVETQTSRIIKYNLKGPKAGQQEIFVEGLPGGPDNIHSDGDGGFLVSMVLFVVPENPQIWYTLLPHPYLRKMIVRLFMLMELPFKLLHDIYPNLYTEKIMHAIGSFNLWSHFLSTEKKSIVLRIDADGNIMEALSSDDDTISSISSSYIHNGYLWFGSPWNTYLARIPLRQAFPDLVDNENQSSHARSEKQSSNAAASDVKSKTAKRDTASTTAKPVESKPKRVSTQTTPKPTVVPTTPKPTPKPTPAPTTTSKPTTVKSTVAPIKSKPTAAPKPSPVLKADKPAATDNNVKPSETKPISKSENAEIKDNVKTVNDAKPNTKLNSPDAKSETNNKAREDATKKTSTKSEKNVKMEQDTSIKQKAQKVQSEKIKSVETNRPRDDL